MLSRVHRHVNLAGVETTPYVTARGAIGRSRYDNMSPFSRVVLTPDGMRVERPLAGTHEIAWADVADVREVGPSLFDWKREWVFLRRDGSETWFAPWRVRRFRRLLAQVQGFSETFPASESR